MMLWKIAAERTFRSAGMVSSDIKQIDSNGLNIYTVNLEKTNYNRLVHPCSSAFSSSDF